MDYKKFAESARLFGVPATEKHYEDAEAFIEKFGAELEEAATAYINSSLAQCSAAFLKEIALRVNEGRNNGTGYLDGILAFAFMSGFLAGKGHFKEIEKYKMEQLVKSGDL
jgi:hypothetical protein